MKGNNKMDKKKAIIIGAGPAGLTAAYELLKEKDKYEVIILEETEEIGGISRTVRYNGNRMDIGGHRFFSKDDRIMNFWSDLMLIQGKDSFDDKKLNRIKPLEEGGPDPEKEDEVILIRTRVSRIYYLKKFFDYPISMKIETLKNMGLIRTMKAGFSYLKSTIVKKEETSLENFYINRFGKVLYSMFFEKYTEKLWGRHPSQISADWGSQRVKGLSIKAIIKDMFSKVFGNKNKNKQVETSLIEQFWYPKYGPGQLWETLAKKIEENGGEIKKRHLVKKINIDRNRIVSVECDVDGTRKNIEGDIFISSMPVKDLVEGFKGANIPEDIKQIASGLPYRDFITVGLLVNKLNLINKTDIKTLGNIVPDCWIYVQEPDVKLGRIQIFNNWSPYLVRDPENTVWIGLEYFCDENDEYWNMNDEEFIKFATEELVKMGIIERNSVLDSHREKVKKAYPAYFDTYSRMDELIKHLDTYENLYCIGRNGQHRYNNMDHSMATAIEAVNNIRNNIKTKDNIWNVNTEKEYHEVKEEKDKSNQN
jgi:protoporphyrinogen oxidase